MPNILLAVVIAATVCTPLLVVIAYLIDERRREREMHAQQLDRLLRYYREIVLGIDSGDGGDVEDWWRRSPN